jgi:hypothetical protein
MSTQLLENIIQFSVPSEFAGCLFPERSPALRNERGGDYALPYVRGMETCMTFIRTLENGWKLRDTTNAKQRISMSPRCEHSQSLSQKSYSITESSAIDLVQNTINIWM